MIAEIKQTAGGGDLPRIASVSEGDREEGPLDTGIGMMHLTHSLSGEHSGMTEPAVSRNSSACPEGIRGSSMTG